MKMIKYEIGFVAVMLLAFLLNGCNDSKRQKNETMVSIHGDKWYINDEVINKGTPAEGLLMNVRMVNSVFEDRGPKMPDKLVGFNPMSNTENFIVKIPEYVANGVNAFTVSLQGGSPGYEGAINTAFNSDGSLRDEYLLRVEKVIRTCDANHAVVILSCFYQRQHSHFSALKGKESIKNALKNTVDWILQKDFTNVILEVSNEYRHGGYQNWPDGEWLISETGQVELIQLAKQLNPKLLISTSGMGNGKIEERLIAPVDFLTIHFNNTSLDDYSARIAELKKYNKPIICNEDDKQQEAGALSLVFSVMNGCGWGYMNLVKNQGIPFEFNGLEDDPLIYEMFKNVNTPGYQFDQELFNQTFLIITKPNDGQVFTVDQNMRVMVSIVNHSEAISYTIEIIANNKVIAQANEKLQADCFLKDPGLYILEAVLRNDEGKELCRSPKVDIIIQSGN